VEYENSSHHIPHYRSKALSDFSKYVSNFVDSYIFFLKTIFVVRGSKKLLIYLPMEIGVVEIELLQCILNVGRNRIRVRLYKIFFFFWNRKNIKIGTAAPGT